MYVRHIPPFAFLAFALATGAVHAGDLELTISVPAGRPGSVLAAVFDKAEGFPRGKPLRTVAAQPVRGKAGLTFAGLPPGDYAATAFLDENGNTQLDANLFGLPTELYGFSRNARGLAGPPPFADAAFRVNDGLQQQAIELK